jgi:hypothetical protein
MQSDHTDHLGIAQCTTDGRKCIGVDGAKLTATADPLVANRVCVVTQAG